MDSIEKMITEHHVLMYNKEEFEWDWCTIDHIGIWAFGGHNDIVGPSLKKIKFCVPKRRKVFGWYCYIGPQPNFAPIFSMKKYNQWIVSREEPLPDKLRRGQHMCIKLRECMPLMAHEIWENEDADAFYDDALIDKMVEYVRRRCEQQP